MDKKLTDSEIVKALECCANCESCDYETTDCPLGEEMECRSLLAESALALINRLQAENERLRITVNSYKKMYEDIQHLEMKVDKIKAEAYKEFAERLKNFRFTGKCIGDWVVNTKAIDNLLKEMVGE